MGSQRVEHDRVIEHNGVLVITKQANEYKTLEIMANIQQILTIIIITHSRVYQINTY